MATKTTATFVDIDESTLPVAARKLLAAKREADTKAASLKAEFEAMVREAAAKKGLIDNVTTTMVFGYRFGKLAGAVVPKAADKDSPKLAKNAIRL